MKLTIDKLIAGGDGISRMPPEAGPEAGMRVFVPFTLPGETVEATVTGRHRGYASADLQQVQAASAFRAAAPCSRFGICGGCQLQHASYPYQLELKRDMLAESLHRAGLQNVPQISTLAGSPLEYRNRIRLQMRTHPDFAIGYRAQKSHRMVAVGDCPIAIPLLKGCIGAMKDLGEQGRIPAGLVEVEAFANHDQSELLLACWTAAEAKFEPEPWSQFFNELQTAVPQLSGVAVHRSNDPVTSGTRPIVEWRQQALQYRAAQQQYHVSSGSFFQVNASLIDAFVEAVVDAAGGDSAWDLYAGVGLFSRVLATKFRHVTAVESAPSSARDLRKNLHGLHAEAIQKTTLDFLRSRRTGRKQPAPRPDLILLDPPRAGVGKEVCDLLAKEAPAHIVYVSCDAATLSRDLARLIQSGYRLAEVQMVDMFPQTGHVEVIAKLQLQVS